MCEQQKAKITYKTKIESLFVERFELIHCGEEELEELDLHFLKET